MTTGGVEVLPRTGTGAGREFTSTEGDGGDETCAGRALPTSGVRLCDEFGVVLLVLVEAVLEPGCRPSDQSVGIEPASGTMPEKSGRVDGTWGAPVGAPLGLPPTASK